MTTILNISRRDLLKGLGSMGISLAMGRSAWPAIGTGPVSFIDVAGAAGITFRHDNAASSEKYLIETMGAGCGWIDYNQDGLLDLYLVNSAATGVYRPAQPLRSALYRNNGDGTFTDVTASAGVGAEGLFGMGVAVGDYDNDGFPDLLVTRTIGRCILYHNNGDGTFADVTAHAGVGEFRPLGFELPRWFDYDNDGRLDLVIANYVDWSPERNFYCGDRGPACASYCHPDDFHGQPPTSLPQQRRRHLHRRQQVLRAWTERRQTAWASSPSTTTTTAGRTSSSRTITCRTSCFTTIGDGTFREVGLSRRASRSATDGQFEAGMGTDAARLRPATGAWI